MPSSPKELSPQQSTIPEVRIAQYPSLTAAKLVAWMPVETGVVLHELSAQWSGPLPAPSPSSPKELSPQQSTIPEVRMAQYPAAPSATRLVAEMPMGTGLVLHGSLKVQVSGPPLVPMPRSPLPFDPQQSTIPEVRIAQYPSPSPAILVAEIPTGTGILLHASAQLSGPVLVPSASSPLVFPPQHTTAPEVSMAQ